jgi:hypothetical protein
MRRFQPRSHGALASDELGASQSEPDPAQRGEHSGTASAFFSEAGEQVPMRRLADRLRSPVEPAARRPGEAAVNRHRRERGAPGRRP